MSISEQRAAKLSFSMQRSVGIASRYFARACGNDDDFLRRCHTDSRRDIRYDLVSGISQEGPAIGFLIHEGWPIPSSRAG